MSTGEILDELLSDLERALGRGCTCEPMHHGCCEVSDLARYYVRRAENARYLDKLGTKASTVSADQGPR